MKKSKILILMLCILFFIGCTHNVTKYRIQSLPIQGTIPIMDSVKVVDNYRNISTIFSPSPYHHSIVLLPFTNIDNDNELRTNFDNYSEDFYQYFINHLEYSDNYILYKNSLINSIIGKNQNSDSNQENLGLIWSSLNIKYAISCEIQIKDSLKLDMTIFDLANNSELYSGTFHNTKNSSALKEAIDLIYDRIEPIYSNKYRQVGNVHKTIEHRQSWVSYQTTERSNIKRLLFLTISTAIVSYAATDAGEDIIDLYDEYINNSTK